jgi:hypothetical protein
MKIRQLALAILLPFVLGAADYYVSSTGNDDGDGSQNTPFKTLKHAFSKLKPGDTCFLQSGVYRETITEIPSGEPEKPITIKGDQNNKPRISTCDKVTTKWTKVNGDIWIANVDWSLGKHSQLFVNGKHYWRARWPNRTDDDLLNWKTADYDKVKSDLTSLVCQTLPDKPDNYWNGAILWCLSGVKYSSWSIDIVGYDNAEKRLHMRQSKTIMTIGNDERVPRLNHRNGGFFFLLGGRDEVDAPREFYYDETAKTLTIHVEPGQDPNAMDIEFQRRLHILKVKNVKHVNLIDLETTGGPIVLEQCENMTLQRIKATWLGHTDGGDTSASLKMDTGLAIKSGQHVTLRDSEIAFSAGSGVTISGKRHNIVNNWIHDVDYAACWDSALGVGGQQHLISHNTIHDTGRDIIGFNGLTCLVQYNHIYNAGRMCMDLGLLYGGYDGGGTEIHHNWAHDNLAKGGASGLYIDNYNHNYIFHHNMVWNVRGANIHVNLPSQNVYVVNNTCTGGSGGMGRWKIDWMYNVLYANNAFGKDIRNHPHLTKLSNQVRIPEDQLNADTIKTFNPWPKSGVFVPGITEEEPGIGAFEPDKPWKAGHDFENPPQPEYKLSPIPMRPLLKRGSFDWRWGVGGTALWDVTETNKNDAKLIHGTSIWNPTDSRNTVVSAGLELNGPNTQIQQTVEGEIFPNQEYEFSLWTRMKDGAKLNFGIKMDDEIVAQNTFADADDAWHQPILRWTTPSKPGKLAVFIAKSGPGTAYVDDIALVGIVRGLGPRTPGFAPQKAPAQGKEFKQPMPEPRRSKPFLIPNNPDVGLGAATQVKQTPGRMICKGLIPNARIAHDNENLLVQVMVPIEKPMKSVEDPKWDIDDGMEVCFASSEKTSEIFILHGFPNGKIEGTTDGGAPRQTVDELVKATTFKVFKSDGNWTGQWTIPLKSAGISGKPGAILDFNIGIRRNEHSQWIQWEGTGGSTYDLKNAAKIILGK